MTEATNTKILIAEPLDFDPTAREMLEGVGTVDFASDGLNLARAFQQYDVVWFRLAHRITAELLGERPRCRVLATAVTGIDHIDLDACRQRGVQVVCLKGEVEFLRTVRATAELTVALLLALLRNIPQAATATKAGHWNRDSFRGNELYGKTAGVVGVGRLGTIVAGYLKAFGMTVLGYDIRDDFPHAVADRVATLEELCERSDVVSLHVSYNVATKNLIGARELSRLRPGTVLVNTSRGGVVDESALLDSLRSGRLAGAALDVLDGEPNITANHPLMKYASEHSNLLIVPHLGGNTYESFSKTERFLAGRVVEALTTQTAESTIH